LGIAQLFDWLVTKVINVGSMIYEGLIWVPKLLLEGFRGLVTGIQSLLNHLIDIWNAVAGTLGMGTLDKLETGTPQLDSWIQSLDDKQRSLAEDRDQRNQELDARSEGRAQELQADADAGASKIDDLLTADPDDGKLFGFDTEKAKEGLSEIGGNLGNLISG